MEKYLIWVGFGLASAQYLYCALWASFQTTVVVMPLSLVFIAAGAALALVEGHAGPGEVTTPADDPSDERREGEGGTVGGA